MRLTRRLAFLVACGLSLMGCSRSYSTLESGSQGAQRIYALTPEEADAAAHNAIVTSFPGRRVEKIDGPVRGYSTYTRMMLDTFTQQVLIRPVVGRAASGSDVEGYAFDVSGSGTSGTGAMLNTAFFDSLRRSLDATGKGVDATAVRPRAVPVPASTPASSGGGGAAERLRTLRDLRDQGLITPTEYERKRAEAIGQL